MSTAQILNKIREKYELRICRSPTCESAACGEENSVPYIWPWAVEHWQLDLARQAEKFFAESRK